MANERTHPIPTPAAMREAFDYNPETGQLMWKLWRGKPSAMRPAGSVHKDGYVYVKFQRQIMLVHRVAWVVQHGEWPALFIDHVNGDRTDNRLSNLRLATPLQSSRNVAASKRSKTGVRGVSWDRHKRQYIAQAKIGDQYCRLGHFGTVEEARDAYLSATRAAFGDFVRAA